MPWYNCLAWAFSQVLSKTLPYKKPRDFVLDYTKTIDVAFIEKAKEFGIKIKKVSSFEELQQYQKGFLVFGYYMEEIQCNGYKDYRDSDFHVVLFHGKKLFHQNGCGVMPTPVSMKALQKGYYLDPIYFAVV